jgi:hemolysin III
MPATSNRSPQAPALTLAARPRLRGWSHAVALIVALPAVVALVVRSQADLPRLLSMVVYGVSLVDLLAVSALYHLWPWSAGSRQRVRALDHANIFIVIAGTYTPFCVNVLSGWLRPTVLVSIWALALIGVACSVASLSLPRWVSVGLYAGLGWVAVLPGPALVEALPLTPIVLLGTGGVLYSVGAVVYARRWPDPLPQIFGFHEVFHLLVLAASAVFFVTIWTWVLPFGRS